MNTYFFDHIEDKQDNQVDKILIHSTAGFKGPQLAAQGGQ